MERRLAAAPAGAVTCVINNLRLGRKSVGIATTAAYYPRLLAEFRRVLAAGGLMVLMTGGKPPDARSPGAARNRAQLDARGDNPRRVRVDLRLPVPAGAPTKFS